MSVSHLSVSGRIFLGVIVTALAVSGCKNTGFFESANPPVIADAVDWLETQQQSDGGFEVSGFAGFETADAVLAIAERAQTTYAWNTTKARSAVLAVTTNSNSALGALDDFADGAVTAGQAAKLIVLVARPLGLSATAFDPQSDGARNLISTVDSGVQADGSYGAFNATLYAALAKHQISGSVPAITVALIRSSQQTNGGWNYSGDSTGTDVDVDTTSLAIQALIAGGATKTDMDVNQALGFLADNNPDGGPWQSFGSDDPNSSATAIVAIAAAGFDPTKGCWREAVRPALIGTAYSDPVNWLRGQQAADGHITSANDAFPPVNTFATSQSVQAIARGWLPVAFLAARGCAP